MRIFTPNHTVKSSKYIITFQIGKIPAPSCLNHLPSSPHGCQVFKLSLTMSMSSASAVGLFSWVSLSIFAMHSFKTARLLWLLLLLLKFFDGAFKFVDASFFGACFLLPHPFLSCDGCRVIFFCFFEFPPAGDDRPEEFLHQMVRPCPCPTKIFQNEGILRGSSLLHTFADGFCLFCICHTFGRLWCLEFFVSPVPSLRWCFVFSKQPSLLSGRRRGTPIDEGTVSRDGYGVAFCSTEEYFVVNIFFGK